MQKRGDSAKISSTFTRCSQHVYFAYTANSTTSDTELYLQVRDGAYGTFPFSYLGLKTFVLRFNAFRRAPFGPVFFMVHSSYSRYLEHFCVGFYLISWKSCRGRHRSASHNTHGMS